VQVVSTCSSSRLPTETPEKEAVIPPARNKPV